MVVEEARKDTALFRSLCSQLEGMWYYDLDEMRGLSVDHPHHKSIEFVDRRMGERQTSLCTATHHHRPCIKARLTIGAEKDEVEVGIAAGTVFQGLRGRLGEEFVVVVPFQPAFQGRVYGGHLLHHVGLFLHPAGWHEVLDGAGTLYAVAEVFVTHEASPNLLP